jgi:hypothetical protein
MRRCIPWQVPLHGINGAVGKKAADFLITVPCEKLAQVLAGRFPLRVTGQQTLD